MNNFNINVVSKKEWSDSIQTRLQIHKRNKKEMTLDELKSVSEKLSNNIPKGGTFMIRALGIHGWRSFKSYDKAFNYQTEEEYLDGKVKETSKFMNKFSQVEFTFIKPK